MPVLSFINQLALIVYESSRRPYARQAATLLSQHPDALARSRHSIKLYEDSKRSVDEIAEYFEGIVSTHRQYFMALPRFAWARRWVTDLGLFRYHGAVIGTTHVYNYNLGIEPRELLVIDAKEAQVDLLHSFTRMLGEYFGQLEPTVAAGPPGRSFLAHINPQQFGPIDDRRSWEYYPTTFGAAGRRGLAPTLHLLQCAANTLLKFLDPEAIFVADVEAAFKLRYVTLYQVASSLHLLTQHDVVKDIGTAARVRQVTDLGLIARMLDPSARPLRNTLVHYGIDSRIDESHIEPAMPLGGLIEQFFPEHTFQELDRHLAVTVAEVAGVLDQWSADS